MGILTENLGRYKNCKHWQCHCIAVDLILKHNQKGSGWEGSDTLYIQLTWYRLCDVTERGVMAAYTMTGNLKWAYF